MSIFSRAAGRLPARQRNQDGRRNERKTPGSESRDAEVGRLLQQGVQLQRSGRLWPAYETYGNVLKLRPNQPDALNLMGLIALQAMRSGHAAQLLKRAVAAKPNDAAMRGNYAEALIQANDPVAAERQLIRALKLSPDEPRLRCKLARCLAMTGRHEEARQILETVLERQPDQPAALIDLANLLSWLGEHHEAKRLYRRAIDLDISPARAFAGLVECERFQGKPPELAEIEMLLKRPGLSATDAVMLSQAAAKICNDIGRYDEAFERYAASKAVLATDVEPTDHAARYAEVRSTFTPGFFAARTGFGNPSEVPVFIVGMPRSGTTLVEQIVASHPQAVGGGEIGAVSRVAASLGLGAVEVDGFASQVRRLKRKDALELANKGLAELRRFSTGAARITDKQPHTFEVLGLAALLYPRASIIHCRRGPLDTCVSCYLRPLTDSQHAYARDVATLGAYYREYATLMEHWRQVLPIPILEVEYEALVADLDTHARRIVDFVGLEWNAACLDFQTADRAVRTSSHAQVRQPIYNTSIGRWRRYEKHLGPLREALGDLAY